MTETIKYVCKHYRSAYCVCNKQIDPSLSEKTKDLPFGAFEGPEVLVLFCTAVNVLSQQTCDTYQKGKVANTDGSLPEDDPSRW